MSRPSLPDHRQTGPLTRPDYHRFQNFSDKRSPVDARGMMFALG